MLRKSNADPVIKNFPKRPIVIPNLLFIVNAADLKAKETFIAEEVNALIQNT
jgi:hypothetical protein